MARLKKPVPVEDAGGPAKAVDGEKAHATESEKKKIMKDRYLSDGLDPTCYGL